MKYISKFLNILLALFVILTLLLLLFGFLDSHIENNITRHIMQYIVRIYFILVCVIVIAMIICTITGAIYCIKKYGVKTFVKEAVKSFIGGLVIVIIISLTKDKMILNPDRLFLLFVFPCLPSIVRVYSIDKKD